MFWVNVIVSSSIALLIAAFSPLIAWFYLDNRVIWVAIAFGANALLMGLGAQHLAILSRHMRFSLIAVINILASIAGIGCAILVAPFVGYFALLVQLAGTSGCRTLGYWLYSGWVPTFHLRNTGVRDKLKMGGNYTLSTFINYFARNGDNVMIAKVWGEAAVGFYSKAYGLLLLPMKQLTGPMSKVAVPALSRLQNEPEQYRSFFRKGVSIAMVLQVPITIFAAVAGAEIVLTILGPNWTACIPIFYALIPNLFISATAPATQWVFISRGDTARLVKAVCVNSAFTLIGFLIGLPYGPIGVALSYSITSCISRIPIILYCFKPAPVSARDFFPFIIGPTICGLIAGGACLVCVLPIANSPAWILLLVKLVCFAIVYALLIATTTAGRDFFTRVFAHLKPALSRVSLLQRSSGGSSAT